MINIGKEWDWMYDLIKNEKEMAKDTRNEVKVKHPDYGHVIFHGPTARQIEVLEEELQAAVDQGVIEEIYWVGREPLMW